MEKKSLYISPQKASEIIPMLGEALLLYDKVALDVSLGGCFDVLSVNIDSETLEYLVGNKILTFVYNENVPIIAKQSKSNPNTILLMDLKKSNIPSVDIERLEKSFKKVYPLSLLNKVKDNISPTQIDTDLLLDNCYADMKNIKFIQSIFRFVIDYFDLPEFIIEIEGNGCIFSSKNSNEKLPKRVFEHATYGLHLIAETNYRMSLLSLFDQIACEKEYEKFFINKLKRSFKPYFHKKNSENFFELCEIHDFPDIKELISSGMLNIKDILRLRKKEGKFLRIWLNKITKSNINKSIPFSKQYSKILLKANRGLPLKARTVVFGLMNSISLFKPVEGTILSATKEFIAPKVLNKCLDNWQPKYFFDKAKNIYVNNQEKMLG